MQEIMNSPDPETKIVCVVTSLSGHNHPIVERENALTSNERDLLVELSVGPSASKTASTLKVLKRARLIDMEPQRQTAYNAKRKVEGRKGGVEGDIERLTDLLKEMKEEDPSLNFIHQEQPFRVIVQTGKIII